MSSIAKDSKVTLSYTLHDATGEHELLDGTPEGQPISFVYGYGVLVPGLEKGLLGLEKGVKKAIQVSPEEGFGLRDDDLIFEIDRTDLPETVRVGDTFYAEDEEGNQESLEILEVHTAHVLVDANHALAGRTLRYEVHILDVVPASADEIAEAKAQASHAQAADRESGPELIPEARRSQPPPPNEN
ncbi:MAG: peptidylprolyl isomerase [Polyangiaceae bacterium]